MVMVDTDFEIGVTQNRQELHAQLIRRLALFLIAFSVFMAWYSLPIDPYPWEWLPFFTVSLVTGLVITRMLPARLEMARWLIMISLNGSFLGALWVFDAPWLPFLSVLFIFISTSITLAGGVLSGISVLIVLNVLQYAGTRNYPLATLSLCIFTAIIVAWLSLNTVMMALRWTQVMYQHTMVLLERTRENRAELVRLVKALEQSNRTLERTQNELVRARQQAEEAKLMKQTFAANISHELRAPLNLILGFSEIMYQTPSVYGEMVWPPRLRQDVSKIYRSSRHLLALIDDILDLTHFEVKGYMLYLESTAVSPFLQETAEMARDLFRGKPVDFQVDIEENLPVINLDRTRIRQVILNLLNNAQRYTDSGTVRLCAKRRAHEIRVTVEDTGPGIPDDQLVHIFGEFYQADGSLRRKNEGAGLGLAISKRFVEAHNGHIWAESTVGVGSLFSFTLPILEISQSKATTGHIRADVRPVVLVVDANEASRRLLKQHIQDFDVVVVSPGDSLIELTEQYAPRALLINTENGTSCTADDLAGVQIPIIEYSIPWLLWIEHQLPVNGYLVKPVSPRTLMQAIQRFEDTHDILIVEDDSNFIHLIERTIQAANFKADLRRAVDGLEALRAMRQQRPDLVLLDVVIPHMDGKQVLEAMQADADLCDIPVLVLTSMTYADNAREYRCRNMLIDRPGGLYPIETLRYLNAILHEIMPLSPQ